MVRPGDSKRSRASTCDGPTSIPSVLGGKPFESRKNNILKKHVGARSAAARPESTQQSTALVVQKSSNGSGLHTLIELGYQDENESIKSVIDKATINLRHKSHSKQFPAGEESKTADGRDVVDNGDCDHRGVEPPPNSETIRDPPVSSQVKSESLIEKKKRMVLYRERLRKKFTQDVPKKPFTHDTNHQNDLSPTEALPMIVPDESYLEIQGESGFLEDDGLVASSGRGQEAPEKKLKNANQTRLRSQCRGTSLGRKNIGLPRSERPRLGTKQSNREDHAPSNISLYDSSPSSGSPRQSSSDNMASATGDPLIIYNPKSPRGQFSAPKRTTEMRKKGSQTVIVYEGNENDEYGIHQVMPLAGKIQAVGASLYRASGADARESPAKPKIKPPPDGLPPERKVLKQKYVSINATVSSKRQDRIDLAELPSPQSKGFNAACGGSSLFSALTELENDVSNHLNQPKPTQADIDKAIDRMCLEALPHANPSSSSASVKSSEPIPRLGLPASSSLFSFPSNDLGDKPMNDSNAFYRNDLTKKTTDNDKSKGEDDLASFDSLYEELEDDDTPSQLESLITAESRNKKGSIFPFASAAFSKKSASAQESRQRKKLINTKDGKMVGNDKYQDRDHKTVRQHHGQEEQVQVEKVTPNRFRLKKFMPFLFRFKGQPIETPDPHVSEASQFEGKRFVSNIISDQSAGDAGQSIENSVSDDEDSKTMITVLEAKDDNSNTNDAIELLFHHDTSADVQENKSKPTMMSKARSSMTGFNLPSPKVMRFPSVLSRACSVPYAAPKVIDGPIYNVRVTLGYLQGVKRIGKIRATRRNTRSTEMSHIVGYAHVKESPAIAFVSSQVAESRPVTATLNDPDSPCHIVWSHYGHRDKTNGRLYFSFVQDKIDETASAQAVNLELGMKMGSETIRLGTVSLALETSEVQGKQCSLFVTPEPQGATSKVKSKRRQKNERNCFLGEDSVHYMLEKDATLRIRLDVREGSLGHPGPALWGDVDDDEQSFIHSLYDMESFEDEAASPATPQDLPAPMSIVGEHVTSVEVVPLSNGSTYISTYSTATRQGRREKLLPPAVVENICHSYQGFSFNPLLETWNCVDTRLEGEGTLSMEKEDDSIAAESTQMEGAILALPVAQPGLELKSSPMKGKKPLLSILRRRVRPSTKQLCAETPSRPAIEEISSPFFHLELSSPKGRVIREQSINLHERIAPELLVKVEHAEDDSIHDVHSGSYSSDEQQINESISRATSYTRSTRKSPVSQRSEPLDIAANWIVDTFRGLLGTSSTDTDDHDRLTTFSHSTGYDGLSMRQTSDFSASLSEDATSLDDRKHRPRQSNRKHDSVDELYTAVSGLSEATSHDSRQRIAVNKAMYDDLKRILAIAHQLDVKPDEVIERIAAGERFEDIALEHQ